MIQILKSVFGPLINALFPLWPVGLLMLGIVIFMLVIKSRKFKGKLGELAVGTCLELKLGEGYRVIHDIMLNRTDASAPTDSTTQIDHVVVGRSGLFVVETKYYKGKIYGKEKDKTWTYCLGGKKFTFQNPIRQNYLHTRTLADLLGIEHGLVRPVVIFCGQCELKTPMPDYVGYLRKTTNYIKSFTDAVLSEAEVEKLVGKINTLKLPSTHTARQQHIKTLGQIHGDPKLGSYKGHSS